MAEILLLEDKKTDTNILKINNGIKSLSKEAEGLKKRFEEINKQKLEINSDSAKSELAGLERSYINVSNAKLKSDISITNGKYGEAASHIKLARDEVNQLTDGIKELNDTVQDKETSISTKTIGSLIASGNIPFSTSVSESESSEALTMSNVSSKIASFSTDIKGKVIGSIMELLFGAFEDEEKFLDNVSDSIIEAANNDIQNSVKNGSAVAADREKAILSLTKTMENEKSADDFIDILDKTWANSNFQYNDIIEAANKLITDGYGQNDIVSMIETVGKAGKANEMSSAQMSEILTLIGEMYSSNVANTLAISLLENEGIDAYGYLGEHTGMDEQEIKEGIDSGEITGKEVSTILMNSLKEQFNSVINEEAQTFADLETKLGRLKENLDVASGEGYNERRSIGMNQEILWYEQNEERAEDAYRMMGIYQAQLENEQQRYQMESMTAALDEIEARKKNNENISEREITDIVTLAKTQGLLDWYNSSEYKSQMSSQEIVLRLTHNSVANIENALLTMYNIKEKMNYDRSDLEIKLDPTSPIIPDGNGGLDPTGMRPYTNPVYSATGISRVPYDGYRAILHEGERVVTASKAKESERTKGGVNIGNINITASGAINDDETFARMLASQLEKALAAYAV